MSDTKSENRRELTRRSDRIRELLGRIESCGDVATRAVAQELLQAVIELHAVLLERIVEASEAMPQSPKALDSLPADELVSGVLALHNIHVGAPEAGVECATEPTVPYQTSPGGGELGSIQDEMVRILLHGTYGAFPSSVETLKQTVETAIYSVAPEIFSAVAESSQKRHDPIPATSQAH